MSLLALLLVSPMFKNSRSVAYIRQTDRDFGDTVLSIAKREIGQR